MSEWEEFVVGTPAEGDSFNPQCMPFSTVSHVSHVKTAIDIFQARRIRPSIVTDKSKLNDSRILVSWLSPNYWYRGSRYGNIEFVFPMNAFLNRRYYWVESIAYRTKACRILITDENHDSDLQPYDPAEKSGPWWWDSDSDSHYFNSNYCLEFMIESPIGLENVESIDFVDHNSELCALYTPKSNCPEIGIKRTAGGARFLTRAIVSGTKLDDPKGLFLRKDGSESEDLRLAYRSFCEEVFDDLEFGGDLDDHSDRSLALMRGVMSAYTFGFTEEAKLLANEFDQKYQAINVAKKMFKEAVGLESRQRL